MSALICGSFAFDTIMVFKDQFKNHILPDKVHILNVSFYVPEMRREFGGCAGNIAYNLELLGGKALPMGTVGDDFAPYAAWMDSCGIDRSHVKVAEGTYTAQAFITTRSVMPTVSLLASYLPTAARACLTMRHSLPMRISRSSLIRGRACQCLTAMT